MKTSPAERFRLLVLCAVLLLAGASVGGYLVWRRSAPIVPTIATAGLDAEVVAAVEQARADVLAEPRSAAAWGRLGMVLFAHDMYAESAAVLAEAEHLDPEDARWPYLRGLALILQHPESGIAALKRAAAIAPFDLPMQLRLAEEYLKLDHIDEADTILGALLAQYPSNPRVLLGQGQILSRRGQWKEAIGPLTAAAADPTARRSAHVAMAEAYLRLGDAAAAESERQKATRLPPDRAWPDPLLAETESLRTGLLPRIEQALELHNSGKTRDGLALISEVLRDHPDSGRAHLAQAQLRIASGALAPAEAALRRAIELKPDLVHAHFLLGQTRSAKKDDEGAERCYRSAIDLMPNHALAHYHLGEIRLKQGKKAEAQAAFMAAVRCRPDLAAAHVELGALFLDDGRAEDAAAHLENAVRLDGTNDRIRALLAQARTAK